MSKILLHFAARYQCKPKLLDRLKSVADSMAETNACVRATVMSAHTEDAMRGTGNMNPLPQAFDASLELLTQEDSLTNSLTAVLENHSLHQLAHLDLSASLIGTNKVFVPCEPTPIRFQYCMRRRADYSDAQYFEYYEQHHVEFGLQMPGIEGYAQFHVDQTASANLAATLGFGIRSVSSVSELHIANLESFFAAVARGSGAGDAGQDEDKFVDRARSVMWLSDEIHRAS